MNFREAVRNLNTEKAEIRAELGDDGAEKVNAILSILMIGHNQCTAYSRAILAAANLALDKMSALQEWDVSGIG